MLQLRSTRREEKIMKAARYPSYGDSAVLRSADADRPLAGPSHVVVKAAGAAALPSAGRTACQPLFEYPGLKEGQRALINGAGGAVGGYAVQLAKRAGATVIATASAHSADRVRSYGAGQIVDYTATPLLEAV